MLIRVRATTGIWRLEVEGPKTTIQEVMHVIAREKGVGVQFQTLSSDPGGSKRLGGATTLAENNLAANGSMLYLKVEGVELSPEGTTADEGIKGAPRRKIGADGSIVETEYDDYTSAKGFRPGMSALGDIKKHWTLTQFLEMDEAFNFKIKRQENADCTKVSLDTGSCVAFQTYLQQLGWRQSRCAYLYGSFNDDSSVTVEAVYEPRQEGDAQGVEFLEDPHEEDVEHLAKLLGMRRVGWIFAHPPREDGFVFSGAELLKAATMQLEAAEGVAKTPFVSVRVTVTEKGDSNFEAYSCSLQAMSMVAEGALEADPDDLAACLVHPTFTAIVEGKPAESVNTNFFICNVPVVQHTSETFVSKFPKENRVVDATKADLAATLRSARNSGFVKGIADFSLLCFLSNYKQIFDPHSFMPALCNAIVDRSVPLDDGYALIMYSFAGVDH